MVSSERRAHRAEQPRAWPPESGPPLRRVPNSRNATTKKLCRPRRGHDCGPARPGRCRPGGTAWPAKWVPLAERGFAKGPKAFATTPTSWRRTRFSVSEPRGERVSERRRTGIRDRLCRRTRTVALARSRRLAGDRRAEIGPAWTNVWNSPFSPHGSTSGGRSASSSRQTAGRRRRIELRGSTQTRIASKPPR